MPQLSFFCAQCGWHPCRCQPLDWRVMERVRPNKVLVSWRCYHGPTTDFAKHYDGVGLRKAGER